MFNIQKEYIPVAYNGDMGIPKYSCLVIPYNVGVAVASDIKRYGIMEFDNIFEISGNYLSCEHITISFDEAEYYSWCEVEMPDCKVTYRRVEVDVEKDYDFINLFC